MEKPKAGNRQVDEEETFYPQVVRRWESFGKRCRGQFFERLLEIGDEAQKRAAFFRKVLGAIRLGGWIVPGGKRSGILGKEDGSR
jgi:hypothetical protein